jgi:hypothetical protein
MGNAYVVMLGKYKGRNNLVCVSVNDRIILKWIIQIWRV